MKEESALPRLTFQMLNNGGVRVIGLPPKPADECFGSDPAMLFDALEEWLNLNGVYMPDLVEAARSLNRRAAEMNAGSTFAHHWGNGKYIGE